MTLLSRLALLCIFLNSVSAHALSLNPFATRTLLRQLHQSQRAAGTQTGAACTDFTGSWEGTCTSSAGGMTGISLPLAQVDCEFLVAGSDILPIGGLMTGTIAGPSGQLSYATSQSQVLDWNSSRDQLLFHSSSMGRGLGFGEALSVAESSVLKISEGALVIENSGSEPSRCLLYRTIK